MSQTTDWPQMSTPPIVAKVPTRRLANLSVRLQSIGRESRSGSVWLDNLAILALTVCTWLALVVVGGTLMFYRRYLATQPLPQEPTVEQVIAHNSGEVYVQLAIIACVFVIPAMMSLVAQSAVLGAAGRERRLATLRLIGLSNWAVTRMTLVETAFQSVIGMILGTILAIGTAPVWALISFNNEHLDPWDMLLPWWGYPAVWAAVLILALSAAIMGLTRVLVSPLGVSRREMPKSLRLWRLVLFIALLGGIYVAVQNLAQQGSTISGTIAIAAVLFVLMFAVNVFAPLAIQILGRVSAFVPGAFNFVATRRVATNAKETWRRVSAMSYLSFLLGYLAFVPPLTNAEQFGGETIVQDVEVGMIITFSIGFLILLVSTVLTQASAVFEQSELTKALDFIGAPIFLHRRVAFKQTFYPMLVSSAFGFSLGALICTATIGEGASGITENLRAGIIATTYLATVLIAGLLTYTVEPLRRSLLERQVRRND